MNLELGKVYKSLAGCPVKLLELHDNGEGERHIMAEVEYVSATNNYGYGKGSTGWFYAKDLREWVGEIEP